MAAAEQRGETKGKEKAKTAIKTAIRLIALRTPIDKIVEETGLEQSEVQELWDEINSQQAANTQNL